MADADAALAAGALHDGSLEIGALKRALHDAGVVVRLP
jgi:imidazole glycerol phosphate synthase subunit HisF